MDWSVILSLGAVEIANNCFLAGQGYEVNYMCIELSSDPAQIQKCQENLDKSLAFAEMNSCAPRSLN